MIDRHTPDSAISARADDARTSIARARSLTVAARIKPVAALFKYVAVVAIAARVSAGIPDFTASRPKGPRAELSRLPHERPPISTIKFGNFRPFNPIDNFILARLQQEKIRPGRLCDDWDFARRASLDLVGLVPTATDLERYFGWKETERRGRWVDHLLSQAQYADHWTIFWGDLLREQSRVPGAPPDALKQFIHGSLRENQPYDVWVRELMTAEGTAEENPAVAFLLRDRLEPETLTVSVTQSLLGVQLKCAQCHDHPFDWWTQRDFQGMAGFWRGARVYRDSMETRERRGRVVNVPVLGVRSSERRAAGIFLTGATSGLGAGPAGLADLLTRKDNPYFARVAVNRLWEKLMGVGLVNPADGFSPLNPPSHPELLGWLALEFIDHDYDLKHILRLITNSRTYQQASSLNVKTWMPPGASAEEGLLSSEGSLFDVMPLRKMTAEQVHDSILAATGRYWLDEGALRASIKQPYPANPRSFLRIFGAPDRDTLLPRSRAGSIQQALTLLNGDFVNRAVTLHQDHPLLYWQRSYGLSTAQMVDAMFIQFLTRLPTSLERRKVLSYVGFGGQEWAWEDVQWALINTREFQYIR